MLFQVGADSLRAPAPQPPLARLNYAYQGVPVSIACRPQDAESAQEAARRFVDAFKSIPQLAGRLEGLSADPSMAPVRTADRLIWMARLGGPEGAANIYIDQRFARHPPSGYTLADAIQAALIEAPRLAKSDFPRAGNLDIGISINLDGGLRVQGGGMGYVNLQPAEIAKLLGRAPPAQKQ